MASVLLLLLLLLCEEGQIMTAFSAHRICTRTLQRCYWLLCWCPREVNTP